MHLLVGRDIDNWKICWNISLVSKGKWCPIYFYSPVLKANHKNRKLLSSARLMGRFNSSRGSLLAMILLKDEARSTSTGEKTPQLDPLAGVSSSKSENGKAEYHYLIRILGKGRKLIYAWKCVELLTPKKYVKRALKSPLQHCERSELRLHFEWTIVH